MGKKFIASVLVVIMAASLAACGSSSSVSTETSTGTDTAGSTTTSAATSTDDTTNDTIKVGVMSNYATLQPFQGPTEYSAMVYETLGQRTSFGGDFYGILMKDYEQKDDYTYDVTIYDNIYDSQGNQITASDVAFSWATCKTVGQQSEINSVKSVTAISDYVVEFVWQEKPDLGDFEAQMGNVYIVSQKAYEASADQMATDPVGTGPYAVSDYVSGVSLELQSTDKYWQSEDLIKLNSQKAPFKNVIFDTISETSQLAMALETGSIDVSADISSNDVANFADGGEYADKYDVQDLSGTKGYVLFPNCSSDSPLQDINLRKAIYAAIDTNFITSAIQSGACKPLYAMGCDSFSDYQASWKDIQPVADLDKAKEYLAKSAYPDGCTLKIACIAGMDYSEDVATIIQGQLSQIGITVEIDSEQISNYLGLEGDSTKWDFTIAHLEANDYITNTWAKYFDTEVTGLATTKNFITDPQLQTLISTCTTVDGHTEANIDATWKYIVDNAYCDPLIQPDVEVVYNSDKIAEVTFSGMDKLLVSGFTAK